MIIFIKNPFLFSNQRDALNLTIKFLELSIEETEQMNLPNTAAIAFM